MNRTTSLLSARRGKRPAAALTAAAAVAAASSLLAGCGGQDNFAKVNGQVITKDEYIKALERQVVQAGGQQTNAERLVLDQLIGNKVILAEASKNNVLPTDAQVDSLYKLQKDLYEQSVPGKEYEKSLAESGSTPEEVKNDLRVQLAETALYAKKLKIDEGEVRKTYDQFRSQPPLTVPARAQLRMIMVPAAQVEAVKKELANKAKFADVASKYNVQPQLKNTGGLVQQAQVVSQFPPAWQQQYEKTPDGSFFGPVDIPGGKAWIMVEKKLAQYTMPFEGAAPLVRRQVVQEKLQDPANAAVRTDILKQKMDAKFEPSSDQYATVWNAVKEQFKLAGGGEAPPAGAPPVAPVAPGAPGGAAPGATAQAAPGAPKTGG